MSGFRRRTRPDAFDEVGLTIPLEVLSSNLKPDRQTLLEILSGLSRDDTLLMCARLNTVVSGLNAEFTNGPQRALAFICNDEEIKKIGGFAKQHGGEARVVPFFRGQLLELIRYVAKYCGNLPGDGNTFQDPEVRSRFVKAALIAAQLWSDRVYGTRLSDHENVEVARVRALGAFRKGVEESNAAPFIGQLLGRGVFLFLTYFPLRYPNFHDEFVAASRLTPEEFFNCTAAMSFLTISDRSGSPIFNREGMGTRTAYRELIPKYLKMESQDPEALRQSLWTNFDKIGYRAIRDRPILSLEDGRSIIIDPTFFNEKLSVGPLFALLSNAEKSKANEIFGAFGLAFEDYAIDILKRMYPHTGTLARRFSWNIKGRDQNGRDLEIDAVLNDVKQIVVFEMKAAWLREDAILDESHESYINQVRAKYGAYIGAEGGERPKGVAQLARIVGTISREEWVGEGHEFAEAELIYPVLVVHDTLLDAFGNGDFLGREFKNTMGGDGLKKRVMPLTIITIHDLENLECSIGQFGLRDFLFDYTNDCPHGIRSVHNYLFFSKYKDKLKPPVVIMNKAEGLMDRARQALFPVAAAAEGEVPEA